MTFQTKLTDDKFALAIELIEMGRPVDVVANAVGIGASYLRDRIRLHKIENGTYEPPEYIKARQNILARQPKDTRTFSQRFHGDPLPGRSALDQLKAQQSDRWQMMDISAIPSSCLNGTGQHDDA